MNRWIRTLTLLAAVFALLAPATVLAAHHEKAENEAAAANPCGDNPCADNPCGDNPCDHNPCDHDSHANPCSDDGDEAAVKAPRQKPKSH